MSRSSPNDDQRPNNDFESLIEIFSEIAESPEHQHERLLDELCPDPEVREQVHRLLNADTSTDRLLDHSLFPDSIGIQEGETIGVYTLRKEIAQGGMGIVFLAEQVEPVQRNVALKIIKPGVDTREVIARFDMERQALSMMDHPNIAKVLDAGSTESGHPYFVMELVNGQPITTYCDSNKLTVRQRLELFLPVCRAIQHAHQKGIIHRDIKPSNVLVAEYDQRPVAKVIDFGVAKAINHSVSEMTQYTGVGQVIGTFDYMSPEQSEVRRMDIDTRTDIYSLGILLYELLTGQPPFDKQRLRSVAWEDMLRIIREEDPPRPSSRLSHSTKRFLKEDLHSAPNEENLRRSRLLKGELDWIVLKAIEKDRVRRYETPNEFASDIENYLQGEAVTACPPSAWYRFNKFAKRNKVVLGTTALVVASLILGLAATTWQTFRALQAEREAEANKKEAVAVNTFFLEDLLDLKGVESQLSAGLNPDPNLKLDTLLDRAADNLDTRFANQPDVKANLQATLAESFTSVGRYDRAADLYRKYLAYVDSRKGLKDQESLRVMRELARLYAKQSNLRSAISLAAEALKISEEELPKNHPLTLQLKNDLAIIHRQQGDFDQAIKLHQECLDSESTEPEKEDFDLVVMSNLGLVFEEIHRFEDAAKIHEKVIAALERQPSANPVRVAASLNNLGRCFLRSGRFLKNSKHFAQAKPLLNQSLSIFQRERRPHHPDILRVREQLAEVYCELAELTEAESILDEWLVGLATLEPSVTVPGSVQKAKNMLGWTMIQQNRLTEAEHVLRDASIEDSTDPMQKILVFSNLGIVLHRLGKLDDLLTNESKLQELAIPVVGRQHPLSVASLVRLGLGLLETGDISVGQEKLESAFELSTESKGSLASIIADSYASANERENTVIWTNHQIVAERQRLADGDQELAEILLQCGKRLLRAHAWNEAETVLRDAAQCSEHLPNSSLRKLDTQASLGNALTATQKYDLAEPILLQAYEQIDSITELPDQDKSLHRLATIDHLIELYSALANQSELKKWKKEKLGLLESL